MADNNMNKQVLEVIVPFTQGTCVVLATNEAINSVHGLFADHNQVRASKSF